MAGAAVGVGLVVVVGAGAGAAAAVAGAFAVRTSDAESRRKVPEVIVTSMRRPVWPVRVMLSGTLTFIQPLLTLNEIHADSVVVPPTVDSLTVPVTLPVAGLTQMVALYAAPGAAVVVTDWDTVRAPLPARSYLPPRAVVTGPSMTAPPVLHPAELPSNEGEPSAMSVPAGGAGSAG